MKKVRALEGGECRRGNGGQRLEGGCIGRREKGEREVVQRS